MGKIKVLLTGGSGTLGTELLKIYDKDKYEFFSPSSRELDITDKRQCEKWFENNSVALVIHAAAYTDVKKSQNDIIKCININVIGTYNILHECQKRNTKLVYISTDYVFDGEKGNYKSEDAINPLTNYAKSKASAELMVRIYEKSLIIRTSFYGHTFPYDKAFDDQWTSKDYVDVIAPKILNNCLSSEYGIIHCGNNRKSVYDIAVQRKKDVIKIKRTDLNLKIPRDTSFFEDKND